MPSLPQPGEQFGRYAVVRAIGRGGMGAVFEAREPGLDRPVALKLLSAELADEPAFRTRFLREARTLAGLDSPHVVQVYEQGEHDGRLYIAMQLVQGPDLRRLLAANGPLPLAEAMDLVAQVARALADAHAAGLLHRDVKPSNVLVRERAGERFAYLCDFGIAVSPEHEHTRTSGVIGSVDYMAPERHEGQDASVASDVYSLGCLLWTALTGEKPYAGPSAVQVAMRHVSEPVPTWTGPERDRINRVLRRTMAKDPAARYGSAAEVREALVGQVPVRARRRWPLVVAGAVVVAVVAAGVAVATRDGESSPAASSASPSSAAPSTTPPPSQSPLPAPASLDVVFPSLAADGSCRSVEPQVPGKVEVRECERGDVLVRYTRWATDSDWAGYYDETTGVAARPWAPGGQQWTSVADAQRRYQWSAAFADAPFSVSVEGATPQARRAGIASVEAVAPLTS